MRSKKPNGFSQNDTASVGITGQSSGRVMWWMPNTYQSTTSVSSIGRSAAVHKGSPVSRSERFGKSPHGHRSSGRYGVTHSVCPITSARWNAGEEGESSGGNAPPGTSLYPTDEPRPFRTPSLTTFQAR